MSKSRIKKKYLRQPLSMDQVMCGKVFGNQGRNMVLLYQVKKAWTDIVGNWLAMKTCPKKVQGKTLIIAVESPVWAQELSLMKQEVLQKVQTKISCHIGAVRFENDHIATFILPKTENPTETLVEKEKKVLSKKLLDDKSLTEILDGVWNHLKEIRKNH